MPDTRNSFATSKDGLQWTTPADHFLTGAPCLRAAGAEYPLELNSSIF
jgi:hypothetical protein